MVTSPMVGSAGRPEAAAVASHDAAEAEGQSMNGPSAVSPSNRATGSLARRALSSPTTAPVSPNSAPLHRPHSFLDLAAPATAPVVAQRHGWNLTHRNICRPDYVSSGTAGAVPPAATAAAAAPAPDRSATVSRRKRRTGASPLLDEADEPSAKRQKAANALMEVGGNRAPQWHDDHAATADLIEAALDHAMAATRDQPVATHRGPAGPSTGVDRNPALAAHAARRHNNSIRSELAIRSADPTTTAAAADAAAAAVSLSFAPASGSGLVDGGTSAPSASPPTNNPHLATTAATAAAMSTSPFPSSSAPSSDNNRSSNTNTNRNDDTGDAGDLDDRDAPAPATPFEFVPHLGADLGQAPPDWDGSLLSSCLAFLLPKLPTSGSSAAAAAVNRLLAELAKFAPDQAPPGAADPSRPPRLRDVSLLANRMAVFVKLISLARLTYRQRLALVEFARNQFVQTVQFAGVDLLTRMLCTHKLVELEILAADCSRQHISIKHVLLAVNVAAAVGKLPSCADAARTQSKLRSAERRRRRRRRHAARKAAAAATAATTTAVATVVSPTAVRAPAAAAAATTAPAAALTAQQKRKALAKAKKKRSSAVAKQRFAHQWDLACRFQLYTLCDAAALMGAHGSHIPASMDWDGLKTRVLTGLAVVCGTYANNVERLGTVAVVRPLVVAARDELNAWGWWDSIPAALHDMHA